MRSSKCLGNRPFDQWLGHSPVSFNWGMRHFFNSGFFKDISQQNFLYTSRRLSPHFLTWNTRCSSCCGASWPSSRSQCSTADSATASRSSAAELPPSLALAWRSLGQALSFLEIQVHSNKSNMFSFRSFAYMLLPLVSWIFPRSEIYLKTFLQHLQPQIVAKVIMSLGGHLRQVLTIIHSSITKSQ